MSRHKRIVGHPNARRGPRVGSECRDLSRHIPEKTRLMLAVAAGGCCEFAGCNDFLFEHHLTRRRGVFGQNAHIVAFGRAGPRASGKSRSKVHDIGNLTCR